MFTEGLKQEILYSKETKKISFTEFVNKELVLFSNMDNERSIPSVVDGRYCTVCLYLRWYTFIV